MKVSTLQIRRQVARAADARSGQILYLMAIAMVVLFGMIGLAVDVGHAYERRQFVQGAAHNAARAGAFEVYANTVAKSPLSSSLEDPVVVQRMVDTLKQSGLSVRNQSGNTLSTPSSWTACAASPKLAVSEVYLQAFYIDDQNQQVHSGSGPYAVGAGSTPSWAQGVQVTRLAMCVPHFFTGVIGHGNFDVSAEAIVGLTETTGSFDSANAPFYIYGQKRIIGTAPNRTYAPTLYAENTPPSDLPAPTGANLPYDYTCPQSGLGSSCTTTPGDLVTLHDANNGGGNNNNNWDSWQFYRTPSQLSSVNYSASYIPNGYSLHDGSNRGCLDPSASNQNIANLQIDQWYYNHGGGGHCGRTPNVGDTVEIPLVDEVCKDNNCGDGTQIPGGISLPCASNPGGGYCVRIVGFVLIYITTIAGPTPPPTNGHAGSLVQGYITDVISDPYCIVELPANRHHQACASAPQS